MGENTFYVALNAYMITCTCIRRWREALPRRHPPAINAPPRSTILQSVLVLRVLSQLFGAAPGSRSDCYDAAVANPSPP
eukprot:7209399-Pyramimonas_sp.AAC.1